MADQVEANKFTKEFIFVIKCRILPKYVNTVTKNVINLAITISKNLINVIKNVILYKDQEAPEDQEVVEVKQVILEEQGPLEV